MNSKISIIITTLNRVNSLKMTLGSFGDLVIPDGYDLELIIVDNGSSDHTQRIANEFRHPQIEATYIFESRKGQSNARNTALLQATGDVFLWTDDDVRVPADWIESMASPILLDEADAVAGQIRLAPFLDRDWLTKDHYWRLADTRMMDESDPLLIGANMAFSRRVLKLVPRFDPLLGPGALGFADDTLFSRQVSEAGLRIKSVSTTVEHHLSPTRLLRSNWSRHAKANGESAAYAFYHWYHLNIAAPQAKLALKRILLKFYRATRLVLNRGDRADREGCDTREMLLLDSVSFLNHYLSLQNTERRYSLRGLTLLDGE